MTRRTARALRAAAAALPLFAAAAPGGAGHLAAPCTAPPATVQLGVALPNTARAIRRGGEVVIVAIGSSSTQGVGASDRDHTYPAVLAAELRRRWPRVNVRVINKGVGGETADQMLARFERDVLPYRPQLVIWQMGSNRLLRGGTGAALAETVRTGVARLKAAHSDIVLMDPQYAPRVLARPLHRRIVDIIGAVADDLKIAVFHRFAVMRHWVASGAHRMEDLISTDRLHMNDVSYGCVARLLAQSLDAATAAAPLSPAEASAAGRL